MTVVSATFTDRAYGTSYTNSASTTIAASSSASPTNIGVFRAFGNQAYYDQYIVDSQSTDGQIDVGDNVTFYYNPANGSGESYSYAVYEGYYLNGTTEDPLVESGGVYYLLGQNAIQPYPIYASAYTPVCFAGGTLVRTARGDVAVEHLCVGDLAVTASGAHRPIRWLGHRTTDCSRHPRPQEALPIRIAAHALAPNRPARDLFVSPGHAICVDVVGEVLIPASALVNGSTIQQVEVDAVTYWHVELDSHDILLAENLACESYLDMGNRDFFAENGVVALDASPDAPVPTHADFCRPFHMEGPLVEVVRAQLSARARTLGWRLEAQGLDGLHLLVDGVRIEPQVRGFVARFAVAAEARDVWLVAPTSVPATVVDSPDLRALGACLTGLDLDDGFGASQTIAVDDPRLCVGFHAVEGDAAATWRWTAGRAWLPANLWADREGDFFLRVNLAGPMLPRWVEPAATMRNVTPMALAG